MNISYPDIGPMEIQNVINAVSSSWVSSLGPYLEEFEDKFAKFCGTKYCVLTSNGTTALHLALLAANITEGDEVLVPDLTFVATANAVRMVGATPVFVDISANSLCIDPNLLEDKITKKTKAIIPVHLYGHPADMLSINQIATRHSLFVIEDAAEAHGAKISGKSVGSYGDVGVFSFYGNKIITTGEGGALVTNNSKIRDRVIMLRDHAMDKVNKYWHYEVGYNYRMTNIQAALGLAQLERIEYFLKKRNEILDAYRHYLQPRGIKLNPKIGDVESVNWLTIAILPNFNREFRDALITKMKSESVETRPFFYPMTMLPMYKSERSNFNQVSMDISSRGICLPTHMNIHEEDIKKVSNVLLEFIEQ